MSAQFARRLFFILAKLVLWGVFMAVLFRVSPFALISYVLGHTFTAMGYLYLVNRHHREG